MKINSNTICSTGKLHAMLIFVISFITMSCTSISVYSPEAYKQAVELKVESVNMMSFATMPYSDFQDDIDLLKTELNKAYEYSKGRPQNEISTRQWEILINPEGNLLGGFLNRWEDEGTLSEMFVTEMQILVSDAFDTIIGLESGKIDPSEIK
jgi:hypothetical protein